MHTKTGQSMYFLKKLLVLNVNNKIFKMFYNAFIESALTFCVSEMPLSHRKSQSEKQLQLPASCLGSYDRALNTFTKTDW